MKNTILTLIGLAAVAGFNASAQTPQPVAFATCMACHGPDGKGMLANTPMPMAPPLAGSKFVNDSDGELMASIVFTGIMKEDAKFLGMMAPLGATLDDKAMSEVLTYVRSSFGNTAPAVTADQVKGWREKYNGKPPQKRADIEKLLKPAAAK